MGQRHTTIAGDADAAADCSTPPGTASAHGYPPTPHEAQPPFVLPPDLPGFTGRDSLLETLDGLLRPDAQAEAAVVNLVGVAGVGKSALALHAAHLWRDRFPDGLVWVDLRAESGACGALRHVITLYGYLEQAAQVGDDAPALAGLARAILRDRRSLLIFDGIDSLPDEEVDVLLPGVPGPVALFTSRHPLRIPERIGRLLQVGVMSEREALALLNHPAAPSAHAPEQRGELVEPPAEGTRPEPVEGTRPEPVEGTRPEPVEGTRPEPVEGALHTLAARLGYLPLALDLAGQCMHRQRWTPAKALRHLDAAADRLASLALPIDGDPERAVALAFAFSYDALAENDQEFFRALSPFAPAGFTPRTVGAVMDREDIDGIEQTLERVAALSLVRCTALSAHYTLHPLLRDYAIALADRAGEREWWADQHARYFAVRADWAGRQLGDPTTAPQAVALATAERANLLAAQQTSVARRLWDQAVSLAYRLDDLFKHIGCWADCRRALELGIEAAKSGGLQRDEAGLAHNLGLLAQNHGDYGEARCLYQEALDIARELDDRASVAVILHNLGVLAQRQEDYAEAQRFHQQAAEAFERLGDRGGVARTLHQLGNVAYWQGDYAEARRQYGASLDIAEALGDRASVATTTGQMGMLAYLRGNVEKARWLYKKSLALRRAIGDDKGIAASLHQLAVLAEDQADVPEARRLYREYLDMVRGLGDWTAVAQTLHRLGRLAEDQGDLEEAEQLFAEGLTTLEPFDSPEASITRRSLQRVRERLQGK